MCIFVILLTMMGCLVYYRRPWYGFIVIFNVVTIIVSKSFLWIAQQGSKPSKCLESQAHEVSASIFVGGDWMMLEETEEN